MEKAYVGIDPGKTGGFVIIQGDVIAKLTFPMIGTEYDVHAILEMFKLLDPNNTHVVIEDVKALQKPFDSGNWSLSRGKTILEMCCVALGIPFTFVHSKTWQKEIWQGVKIQQKNTGKKLKSGAPKMENLTKETTLLAIKRLFPTEDLREYVEPKYYSDTSENRKLGRALKEIPRKGTKPHDGIVDGMALAEYCRRKFK